MKNKKILTPGLSNAMNDFVEHLPDASQSFNSTIENEMIVDDKRIKFMAQKIKGDKGMCWHINYKAITDPQSMNTKFD